MNEYKVEGTYKADRGHEHGETKPHKFELTISAKNKIDARRVTELKLKESDDKFDSIREFTAIVVIPPAVEETLQELAE